ncbi:MAG: HTTM domain-containing protein [Cytophagales bacterium]
MLLKLKTKLLQEVDIAPLVIYRIIFGAMILISSIRFLALGWVRTQYLDNKYRFSYYGFEWVKPLNAFGIYGLYTVLIIASICFILGFKYRLAAIFQFLSFTYLELIDKTYYLNHYYFVSLMSFLLIFLPCNSSLSFDTYFSKKLYLEKVPAWTILLIKMQLSIVYFYAGLCKINTDWLFDAMPLKLWLPPNSDMPIIGYLFNYEITAYLFSWFGMIYDLSIPFLLFYHRTRYFAFFAVIIFHSITGYLFQIGIFPLVMTCSATIFFSSNFHHLLKTRLEKILKINTPGNVSQYQYLYNAKGIKIILIVFLLFQLIFPWRYLLYPGSLFWTEEGYRFSWRVMLMEKSGSARFFVKNTLTNKEYEIINSDYLNPVQEKQMSFQPDMILEFAHIIAKDYKQKWNCEPEVRAEVYVTLNGKSLKPFINSKINLAKEQESFEHKNWILPN